MAAIDFPNSPTIGQEFSTAYTIYVWTGSYWQVKQPVISPSSFSTLPPVMNGSASAGTSVLASRSDHVHPTDTSRAPINSPNFTGSVNFSGTVTLNADPIQDLQAATKQYVDAVAQGLHIHASCATATTGNIANLSSPPAVIDGITLTTNMRVLVKNQSTESQNGIYVFNGTALVRTTDFDSAAEIDGGDFVFVTGGTTNNDTGWVQTETVGTVGTDPIVFTQFSGAGTYTAGNGLALTGSQFSINTGVTADLSTAQTLTNKTINGANNTLTVRLANDITGFGTDVATFLATPTSSNLAAAVTDETGSGSLVFATSPTLVTPNIGVATGTSFNSITGLSSTNPLANGIAAFGTSTTVSRADHVHPTDTSRAATSGTLAQFAATTSAELAGVISDETGTGALVFANSPTFSGTVTSSGPINLESIALFDGTSTSITSNSITTIDTSSASIYRSAEYIVQVAQGTKYTVSKLIMIHDGNTAHITEYALIELGTSRIPLTIACNLSGGNVLLQATITDAATTNATVRVIKTLIVI